MSTATPAAPEPSDPVPSPRLRTDAERNRARIVAAARRLFAEHGLDVSMLNIARAAGVGIATLYRRFPTRDALITDVFATKMSAYADAVDAALADPDPWHGFTSYIEQVCAMQAADRGFTHVLTLTFPAAATFEAERARAYNGFVKLIRRAKRAGALRHDFVPEDLVMLLMANAGVIAATGDAAPDTWRRFSAYMIQAFAAHHVEPLPRPPTPAAMYQAMIRLQHPDTAH